MGDHGLPQEPWSRRDGCGERVQVKLVTGIPWKVEGVASLIPLPLVTGAILPRSKELFLGEPAERCCRSKIQGGRIDRLGIGFLRERDLLADDRGRDFG